MTTCSTSKTHPAIRSSNSFAVLLALIALSGASVAQTTAPVTAVVKPNVGDFYKFERNDKRTGQKENETTRKILAVKDDRIEIQENDFKVALSPEFNVIESEALEISQPAKFYQFPLEVGKKWSFKYEFRNKQSGTKARWQLDAEIVGYEKVKVPAGEFDTYKVEYKGYWNNDTTNRNGKIKLTNWFAPSVRSAVRQEYEDGFSMNVNQLVEFKPQQ